jgi:hypothetical protein
MKMTLEINGQTYHLELPDETARALEAIAARNSLTLEGALQQAIVNELFIEEQLDSGGKLILEKGAKLRELEFA